MLFGEGKRFQEQVSNKLVSNKRVAYHQAFFRELWHWRISCMEHSNIQNNLKILCNVYYSIFVTWYIWELNLSVALQLKFYIYLQFPISLQQPNSLFCHLFWTISVIFWQIFLQDSSKTPRNNSTCNKWCFVSRLKSDRLLYLSQMTLQNELDIQ